MWERLNACLDSRLLCLVSRPLAGLVIAGIGGGLCGAFAGVVYGAFHLSLNFVIVGGLNGVLAGAAAGFIAGIMSALDRMTWPVAPEKGIAFPSRQR